MLMDEKIWIFGWFLFSHHQSAYLHTAAVNSFAPFPSLLTKTILAY